MASESKSEKLDDLNEKLLELLECPVCYEHILPPIYQCLTGHIICSKCSIKIGNCPTCRTALNHGTKCLFAEQIARLLTFPCRNADAGCTEKNTLDCLERHEAICPYRTYDCIPGKSSGCSWRGSPTQILEHVKRDHPEIRISLKDSDIFTIPSHPERPIYANDLKIDLIHSHDQTFYLYSMMDQYSSDYIVTVQLVGPGQDSLKYLYHLQLFTVDGKRSVTYINPTMSTDEDVSSVLNFSVDAVRIDMNRLHYLRNHNGTMSFRIKIEELNVAKSSDNINEIQV